MKRRISRVLLVLAVLVVVVAFFRLGLGEHVSFASLKRRQDELQDLREARPWLFAGGFFVVYVLTAALSLPGATVLTLGAGAVLGLVTGSVVVSFASTIGATLAMLLARTLFRDAVRGRFGRRLQGLDRGIDREGAFYLLTIRLVPAFPFFLVNLAMGLTSIRTRTYFWVSQLGMLPATLVYVNAGTQLATIGSPADVASPRVLLSLVALGAVPLVLKSLVQPLRSWRALRRWPRPERFDYNVVVIGAGSGGLVASYVASAVKARVALVERHRMGGDCLNTGCVPSKALLRSAKMLAQARASSNWGIRRADVEFDFADVMERVQGIVKIIEPHDSVERYQGLGVDVVRGEARIQDPFHVRVGDRVLSARTIVVASGAEPLVPPIPGLADVTSYTSDTIWALRELPRRLAVVGGGPIGCELAQAFARLGADVTVLEMLPRLLAIEDEEASAILERRLAADGVRVLAGHRVLRFEREGDEQAVVAAAVADTAGGAERRVPCDAVLLALGRKARVGGFGLEELGVELDERKRIATDASLRTSVPNVFACGDVTGPYQFTHAASHQAWYAAVNALLHPWVSLRADYRVMPWCTFTDPEVARVGLNEQEARRDGVAHEVTTYDLSRLDRAIAEGEAEGYVKVITPPGKDRILGATVVGPHAGEILQPMVLAMKEGIGLKTILGTIHPYPTLAEAERLAAGQWRKAHAPARLLALAERVFAWRRGRSG